MPAMRSRSSTSPKLITGEWAGTMNLTESQAGSDVGALRSKAEPNGDGTYAITGQKIYISWGDNDFTENVCHLVLARLPGAVEGTKGISLFLVPKYLPDESGAPGKVNDLRVVSLEHKMGLHGSPTAVMEYSGATGWLVGPEHGGMKCMFTMMNNARLGVGGQGIGVAEGAYQHALAYATDRKQGKTPVEGESGAIVDHADVRRMLATMKAEVFAARAIALSCGVAIDMARATGEAEWAARAALLTPITKAFGTDTGIAVADMGVQVHGGMGFIEETGAAQFSRDVRVTAIYEGTNGIQSMDLVARKMMDGGEAAFGLLDEIEADAEAAKTALPDLAGPVWNAAETLRETVEWLVAQSDMNTRFAGSVPFLRAFARVLGGYYPPARRRCRSGRPARPACPVLHPASAARASGAACPCTIGGRGSVCDQRRGSGGLMDGSGTHIHYPWEVVPGEGEALEVAPGVLWMRLPLPMKLDHVNVYALDDGDGWTLIDTGFHSKRMVALWQALLAGPLAGQAGEARARHPSPSRSHRHGGLVPVRAWRRTDHNAHGLALCADADARRAGPAHRRDAVLSGAAAEWIPRSWRNGRRSVPSTLPTCVHPMPLGFTRIRSGRHAAHRRARLGRAYRQWPCAGTCDALVAERQSRARRATRSCPRSAPISGSTRPSPKPTPWPTGSKPASGSRSSRRPDQLVLGGHKLPFTGLPLRMRQLIDNHHGALTRLEKHLTEPMAAGECFAPLFKRRIGEAEYGLALVEAMAHCLHLWHEGRADAAPARRWGLGVSRDLTRGFGGAAPVRRRADSPGIFVTRRSCRKAL